MKCIRCGNELPEGSIRCDECDFDIQEYERLQKYFPQREDPIVPDNEKSGLIDNPIFTFIFGLLTLLLTLVFLTSPTFVVIYFIGIILLLYLTFRFSKKPTKVKLIPVKNVGKAMAYFAVSLIVFKVVYELLGLLFF